MKACFMEEEVGKLPTVFNYGKDFTMISLIACFQQKLILPTLCIAAGIGIAGYFTVWSTPLIEGMGFGYMLAGPLAHYFIYDLWHKNEYYFYFNLGIKKSILYSLTIILNLLIGGLILLNA